MSERVANQIVIERNHYLHAGADTFASDRIVENHIANLRKEIERDPRYLHNIRGPELSFEISSPIQTRNLTEI